jgi:hypothetical protein
MVSGKNETLGFGGGGRAPALLLIVSFMLLGVGVQDIALMCRTKNTIHRSCCCKHVDVKAPLPVDSISRTPCCDNTSIETASLPPSTSTFAPFAIAQPTLIEIPTVLVVERFVAPLVVDVVTTTGPPPPDIEHRALRI